MGSTAKRSESEPAAGSGVSADWSEHYTSHGAISAMASAMLTAIWFMFLIFIVIFSSFLHVADGGLEAQAVVGVDVDGCYGVVVDVVAHEVGKR